MQKDGSLSEREKEVARILLQGKSNKQIALELGISTRTVEFHLRNLYTKLGVSSRTEAVLKLTENHLWETPGEPIGSNQAESTVVATDDSPENVSPPIFRRTLMNRTSFLVGILLVICLTGSLMIVNFPVSRTDSPPAATGSPLPADPGIVPTVPHDPAPLPVPTEKSTPAKVVFSPHTVNGYTAAIESYYIDTANLVFHVRISGGGAAFGDEDFYTRVRAGDLYDKNGSRINSSGGSGPSVMDPELIQLEFRAQSHLPGDRFQGQFSFDLESAPPVDKTLAQFRFDFDLPLYPPKFFHPQQVETANGLEILLDQVIVTPDFTSVYLCLVPPSYAPWTLGSRSVLQLGDQQAGLHHDKLLFGSDLGGDRRAGSEPYWAPPVKDGRCYKAVFPVGSSDPISLTLTIPELEKLEPDVLMTGQLAASYPGLSPKEAYHKYLEEHGSIHKGPWIFTVELAR